MKTQLICCLFLLGTFIDFTTSRKSEDDIKKEIIQKIVDNEEYNLEEKPEGMTDVGINMYITDLITVDDDGMEFTAQFYFRQFWNDPRLSFDDQDGKISNLTLSDPSKLWIPDVFFVNERRGWFHNIPSPNVFVVIQPSGDIRMSTRLTVKMSCLMDLRYFPMDYQTCSIDIEPYYSHINVMKLHWKKGTYNPVGITDELKLFDFSVEDIRTNEEIQEFSTGSYSRLTVDLVLRRKAGLYMIQIYIPFCILVIVSWISFWLHQKATSLRLPLLLTILAMMMLQASSINSSLPVTSYVKAIDVWSASCVSFVFGALLQFILVNQLFRRESRKMKELKKITPDEVEGIEGVHKKDTLVNNVKLLVQYITKNTNPSKRIDVVSRFLFPFLFGLFNIVYWLLYRSGGQDISTL